MSIAVLLADAHQMFREGLREMLQTRGDIEVIAEAANGDDAVRFISNQAIDVVIAESFLPRMSATDMIAHISRGQQNTRVIVLSSSQSQFHVQGAMHAGAAGYLVKTASSNELLEAIEAVHAGRRYLCRDLTERLVGALAASPDPSSAAALKLTHRELEVLRLIAEGCSSKEIATQLGLRKNTVYSHRYRLMEKLGIHKTANLVHFAIREGIAAA